MCFILYIDQNNKYNPEKIKQNKRKKKTIQWNVFQKIKNAKIIIIIIYLTRVSLHYHYNNICLNVNIFILNIKSIGTIIFNINAL